jgi:hypothetical protein
MYASLCAVTTRFSWCAFHVFYVASHDVFDFLNGLMVPYWSRSVFPVYIWDKKLRTRGFILFSFLTYSSGVKLAFFCFSSSDNVPFVPGLMTVKDPKRPQIILRLNELEYIPPEKGRGASGEGSIVANLLMSPCLVQFSAVSGKLLGYILVEELWPANPDPVSTEQPNRP